MPRRMLLRFTQVSILGMMALLLMLSGCDYLQPSSQTAPDERLPMLLPDSDHRAACWLV